MNSASADKKRTKGTVTPAAMVQWAGVRMTRQRRAVAEVLLASNDHPTAAQIYERAKVPEPGISLATVYNCLETMAQARLINQLHFNNGPCRYCPNVIPHVHLLDDANNRVVDVRLKPGLKPEDVFDLPEGTRITGMEACLHGHLPPTFLSTNKK